METGVELDGKVTRPAEVTLLKGQRSSMLEVTLQEGRNRQIRRIALSLGHRVLDLQRIAIEDLKLGSLAEVLERTSSKNGLI